MHRTIRWLALGAAVLLLAACSSHKNPNAPLAYVPADTPYLIANLKPLTKQARAGLMPASASSTQWAAQISRLHRAADNLAADNQPHIANLLNAVADSATGKTRAQMLAETGIDPHEMFALYGLGLSPVMRGQLSDPARFHAYAAKLAQAYGQPFVKSTLGKRAYQHLALGKSGLQLLVATHGKQYVVALLSTQASDNQLRMALGMKHPEHSIQDTGRLAKLAKTDGYGPYVVGYVDTTRLPALIAGAHDPFLQALVDSMAGQDHHVDISKVLPAGCKPGLARIAARVPLISFGYTKLTASEQVQQLDIKLAPDIVKAFKGVGTQVPGLGSISNAPLDLAVALPIPAFRNFWLSQAEAVEAKPFICPALAPLNKLFARMQKALPKTAIPPFGDLRGFHLVLDHIDLSNLAGLGQHQLPKLSARLLIASHNPAGLLDLAKAFVPGVATLHVGNHGKPVDLPAKLTAEVGQPAWVAMNGKALAIGFGQGEKGKLSSMLSADTGQAGTLTRAHVTGKLYVAWLSAMGNHLAQSQAKRAASHPQTPQGTKSLANVQTNLAAMRAKFKHLKNMTIQAHMTDHGIRVTGDSHWK